MASVREEQEQDRDRTRTEGTIMSVYFAFIHFDSSRDYYDYCLIGKSSSIDRLWTLN
jgi:hypothetical protein